MPVDSKQQMLSVEEIVNVAVQETDTGVQPELAYASIVKEFQDPNGTFLRYGNTIFIIHGSQKTPGTGTFRALNADTAQNFLESSYKFIDAAYNKGYWLLVTKFKDQSLLNIFRMISKNPPREGMGYAVKRTEDGQYQVNLTLGPKTNQAPNEPQEMMAPVQPQMPDQPPMGALQQMSGGMK